MLATISKGQFICINPKESVDLEGFFKLEKETSKGYSYFTATQKMIVKAVQKRDFFIIDAIYDSLNNLVRVVKNKIKHKIRKKSKKKNDVVNKEDKAPAIVAKPELKVLWVSRHNMQLDGYLTLQKMYPDYAICIYPCQPRILDSRKIVNLAIKLDCKIICAILNDKLFQDFLTDEDCKDLRILRAETTLVDSNHNYSPSRSFNIYKEKECSFLSWKDMKSSNRYSIKEDKLFINKLSAKDFYKGKLKKQKARKQEEKIYNEDFLL